MHKMSTDPQQAYYSNQPPQQNNYYMPNNGMDPRK